MARRNRLHARRGWEEIRGSKRRGGWQGHGVIETDQITGWKFPLKWMVRQCGWLVSRDEDDGSFNVWEEADEPFRCTSHAGSPRVSVEATDAAADESGGTGTFTVTRTGDASSAVTIYFSLTGTATEGTDYQTVTPHSVTMAAGITTATVTITPIADAVTDVDETVVLTVYPDPNAPLTYYVPIATASATVTIEDV